jgi:peptidoglycan/LPS O-acetylase OafA/YrhL
MVGAAAGSVSSRIPGLDLGRFIACLGVIWLHFGTPGFRTLGYFRLPFFTILLTFLAAGPLLRGDRRPFRSFLAMRAQRLLIPIILWMVLYRLTSSVSGGKFLGDYSVNSVLLGLGNLPLWYLPFAFCASLVTYGLVRLLPGGSGARRGWGVVLLAAGLIAAWIPLNYNLEDVYFWKYWLPLTGVPLLGVGISLLFPALPFAPRHWGRAIFWASLTGCLAVGSMFVHPALANFLGTLSGLSLFLAGLAAPLNPANALWKYLGQLSYGMYLAHFAIGRAFCHLGLDAPQNAPVRFVLTVLCAMTLSAILLRLPWGRLLLGLPPHRRGSLRQEACRTRVALSAPVS